MSRHESTAPKLPVGVSSLLVGADRRRLGRKVGRCRGDEVEGPQMVQEGGVTEVSIEDASSGLATIEHQVAPRQTRVLDLSLDAHELGVRIRPRQGEQHRADTASEIQYSSRLLAPLAGQMRHEHIIDRVAMSGRSLDEAIVPR